MGKGQIISGGESGQYTVKLLYDRVKADKSLARINGWITRKEEQIAALPVGDPKHELPGLKLALASLQKQKEYLERIPADPTVSAWCADLTEDLEGEIGTIEINGDTQQVLIRPGYEDGAEHDAERDGVLQHIMAMTPEQAFYNMAMLPGWKKWMPTYRIGTITVHSGDNCNVKLVSATTPVYESSEVSINEADTLSDVPFSYMSCNGDVFKVGDRVLIQFFGQDFDSPKVIGFETNPVGCSPILWFQSYHYEWYYRDRTRFKMFAWDVAKNDYADNVYHVVSGSGTVKIEKSEWPIDYDVQVFGESIARRFGITRIGPHGATFIAEDACIVRCEGISFNAYYIEAGDYIWPERHLEKSSRIKFVQGSLIQTESLCITQSMMGEEGFKIGSYCPLYFDRKFIANLGYTTMTGDDFVDGSATNRVWDVCEEKLNLEGTSVVVKTPLSSSTISNLSFDCKGANGHVFNKHIYEKSTSEEQEDENHIINNIYHYWEEGGQRDPLGGMSNSWSVNVNGPQTNVDGYWLPTFATLEGDVLRVHSQSYEKPVGISTFQDFVDFDNYDFGYSNGGFTDQYIWQYYTYRGYERNTHAQCKELNSPGDVASTQRSPELEAAIKKLISESIPMIEDSTVAHKLETLSWWAMNAIDPARNLEGIGVGGAFYSGKRTLKGDAGMVGLLNGIREYPVALVESPDLMAACKAKVEAFVDQKHISHDILPPPSGVGECLSIAYDKDHAGSIEAAVAGWMSSPHHSDIVMNEALVNVGWAMSSISVNLNTGPVTLTLGASNFDSNTGTYSTTEETVTYQPTVMINMLCLQMGV